MIDKTINEERLFNDNTPIYIKALMLDEFTKDLMNGKSIGRLDKEFKSCKEGELLLVSYYQEFFNYIVTVFKYSDHINQLYPIDFKVFKELANLQNYLSEIKFKQDKEFYQYIRTSRNQETIFDIDEDE